MTVVKWDPVLKDGKSEFYAQTNLCKVHMVYVHIKVRYLLVVYVVESVAYNNMASAYIVL